MIRATVQLMFQTSVQDVIDHWRGAFPDMEAEVLAERNGRVTHANVAFAGHGAALFQSPVTHGFDFTPSFSFLVTCDRAEEVDRLAGHLGQDGQVMMPLDAYEFSPHFTFIADRFCVSWQIMQAPS